MTEEFNLSKKIKYKTDMGTLNLRYDNVSGKVIFVEDVKEFVRRLKLELIDEGDFYKDAKREIIDKLAGEELK